MVTRSLAAVIVIVNFLTISAWAAELRVEPRRVQVGESVVVTLVLDDDWAKLDHVRIPVHNLDLGTPSTYTQYSWINGRGSRTKTLRYDALALRAGIASVGPVVLEREGRRAVLPQVSISVVAEAAPPSGATDDELEAGARDRLFVIASSDATTVYEGQPVIVNWHLYALESLRQIRVTTLPKLDDFWVENLEQPRGEPEFVMIGNRRAQRVLLRRSALFPTRSGELTVGALGVTVEVMQPVRERVGPFGSWNATVVDLRRRSSPIAISVRPVPRGVDVVGDVALDATPLRGGRGAPVTFDVTLSGSANLRAIEVPRLDGPVAAAVKTEDRGVKVDRGVDGVSMTRSWRFVLFPRAEGTLRVPAVTLRAFDPQSGATKVLRAGGGSVPVAPAISEAAPADPEARRERRIAPAWYVAAAALFAGILGIVVLIRRRAQRVDVGRWVAMAGEPAALRAELDVELARRGVEPSVLVRDPGAAGEAWRAVLSWIDVRTKFRDGSADESALAARLRDLFGALPRR